MSRPHPALIALAADRPLEAVTDPIQLVDSAFEHRMAGLLASRVRAGQIDLEPDSRRRIEEADLVGWGRNRLLAEVVGVAFEAARQVGVDLVVMKGLTTEVRWYDGLGERPSYDVDFAVHPSQLDRLPSLVGNLQPSHSLLPHLGRVIERGHLQSVDLAVNGLPVDLHWDPLKLELISTRDAALLFDRTELVRLPSGTVVRAFDTEVSLIGHLLHLNKDRFRYLLGFADIARIVARSKPDWDFIQYLLDREGLRTPVALSLASVVERLDLSDRPPLAPVGRLGARLWRLAWPRSEQLLGDTARVRLRHRQFLIPFTGSGRAWETSLSYLRRLVPPAELVDYYYPHAPGPYLWKLVMARLRRRVERSGLRSLV